MNMTVGDQKKADFDGVGFLDNAQAPPGALQAVKVLRIVCMYNKFTIILCVFNAFVLACLFVSHHNLFVFINFIKFN